MVKLSLLAFALVAISAVNGAVILRRADNGPKQNLSVTVESEQLFCSFLPSQPGQGIGASEDTAIPFCTQANPPNAPGAQAFAQGYIVSAHFASTADYVQVTGKMNPSAAGLDPKDTGGQYDSVGAPPGAICTGYDKFVNLVEPSDQRYCIRCCKNEKDCNTGESTAGCPAIIPGDYS